MNAKNIESKFAAMGARLKVREVASRWRQGDRTWTSPNDFAVDIQRDGAGEFFELRVPIVLTREAARITTDNIFDLLAGFRSEDSETTTYTRELPFEATADYYDFLDLILRNELSQSEVARLTSRSRNYNQFLRLLSAIEKAEALNTRVLID